MTHKIDPNVDEAREYVLADLADVNKAARFGYVPGVGPASASEPRVNLTRDPYHTDGLRLVLEVAQTQAEPKFLGWEFPYQMAS